MRFAAGTGDENCKGLVAELEEHLESISRASWRGAWLPKEATCTLACLVTACALRPGVEMRRALALVQRGIAFTQQGLDAEGVTRKVGSPSFSPDPQYLEPTPQPWAWTWKGRLPWSSAASPSPSRGSMLRV